MHELTPETVEELRKRAAHHREHMVEHLLRLVAIETPTPEPHTLDAFFPPLMDDLRDVGFTVERLDAGDSGGCLIARDPTAGDAPRQLVVGHADTVWPLGTLEDRPAEAREGRVHGPGSLDMKGGLTMLVFALRILREAGVDPALAPVVIVNSDEETGSEGSRHILTREAQAAERALVLEPSGGGPHEVKTTRKGTGRLDVHVEGVAAHSGVEPEEGASAILELAHVIQELHDLQGHGEGVTVNVGRVEGGIRSNVVAPDAHARVDFRASTHEAARRLQEAVDAIEPTVPGTAVHVEGGLERPPMVPTSTTRAWFQALRDAARPLGLDLQAVGTGGSSDGNDVAQHVPTLDGLGPVGDGVHQPHEHVVVDHLVTRTALLAVALATPTPAP